MKLDIDRPQQLAAWLDAPQPAVFHGIDLRRHSAAIASRPIEGCVFLGCRMEQQLEDAAAHAGCLVMPPVEGLPFDPFTPHIYTPDQLYDHFDPTNPASYRDCMDYHVYASLKNPQTGEMLPADVDTMLFRRLHDACVAEALDDVLDPAAHLRCVAIMGGHDRSRTDTVYREVARLGLDLARNGFIVITGGGPGLMEAANLGAYAAGFDDADALLLRVISQLAAAPTYKHERWLADGFAAWKAMGVPARPELSRNFGVPTWFYGHEPPNVFATHIAKYFENSVREEGLLAVALGGVVFAPGNAGTVQEIFQDGCQNYYRTYAKKKSPMILYDTDYWNPAQPVYSDPNDRRKPAYPLLRKLAAEKGFEDYLLLTGDLAAIVPFLKAHPPV
ncbi:MAG: hypothetical protein JNL98_26295 [Bryobacterales bacterium]|nr:hypothetical protein [Bryobacterales bacterium]